MATCLASSFSVLLVWRSLGVHAGVMESSVQLLCKTKMPRLGKQVAVEVVQVSRILQAPQMLVGVRGCYHAPSSGLASPCSHGYLRRFGLLELCCLMVLTGLIAHMCRDRTMPRLHAGRQMRCSLPARLQAGAAHLAKSPLVFRLIWWVLSMLLQCRLQHLHAEPHRMELICTCSCPLP